MAQLIDSAEAEGESDPWTPSGPFTVQTEVAENSRVRVELFVRADPAAPWVRVGAGSPADPEGALIHCPYHPVGQAMVVFFGNTAGSAVNSWVAE